MKLLAEGRASEIYALDDQRVLRRFKAGGNPMREARVMARALEHGYPVPRVLELREDGLILERVEGATMKESGLRDPAKIPELARMLARLHDRLHQIPGEGGGALLHLDLHPQNVLLSPDGPVVVDWANAEDGPSELDPALTWVILMTSVGPGGKAFAQEFEQHVDVRSALPEAGERRMRDRNVTVEERNAVGRLLAGDYD